MILGGFKKKAIYREELLKNGELRQFTGLGADLAKKGGWCFWGGEGGGERGGVDNPTHTLSGEKEKEFGWRQLK